MIEDAPTAEGSGTIGLRLFPDDRRLAEVGYSLRRRARGRGAATTALRLVSNWAIEELGIQRVNLMTAPENVASQRVAERAGFTREGLLRAWMPTLPRASTVGIVRHDLLGFSERDFGVTICA